MEALRLRSSPLHHLGLGVWRQLRQASSRCYVLALFLEMAEGMTFLWPGGGRSYTSSLFRRLAMDLVHCHVADVAKRLPKCSRRVVDIPHMCGGAAPDGRYKKQVASLAAQFGFSLARQKKHTILKRVVDYDGAHHQQTLTAWKTPSNQQETKRLEARVRRMDDPELFDADKLRAMAARVSRSATGATGMSPPVAGRRARTKPRRRDLQRTDASGLSHSQSPDILADYQSSVCNDALQCLPLDMPTSHLLPSRACAGASSTSTRVLPQRRRRRNRWWNK